MYALFQQLSIGLQQDLHSFHPEENLDKESVNVCASAESNSTNFAKSGQESSGKIVQVLTAQP